MPKRPRFIHPVRTVRTTLGHTQASFAKLVGCSTVAIQRVENGTLPLSHKLATTIFEATGANPVELQKGKKAVDMEGKPFAKDSHENFRAKLSCIADQTKTYCNALHSWIELLFVASQRAGQEKTDAVFTVLQRTLKKIALDFNLEKNIHGFLKEVGSVRNRSYRVSDLRKFPVYAKIIGFKDNKRFKPDKVINFVLPHGWVGEFAWLEEQPVLPPKIAKKYQHADFILDGDRPIPKEMKDDLAKAKYWRIKEFRLLNGE
jgi:transcriptional regulator with XRE-family HTH domain